MAFTGRRPDTWRADRFLGVHYDLHANEHDTELGRDLDPARLRQQLEHIDVDWVQCDAKGGPGYTSYPTEVGTPAPGIVRDALRIHRETTSEMGLPLAVHYMGIRNKLAVTEHPDWAQLDQNGTPSDFEVCLHSPYAVEVMIPQMLDIIDRYDVDGFWVDGDLWFTSLCWCDRCRALFAAEANTGQDDVPTHPTDLGWDEWLAFHRRAYIEHVRRYVDAVHERKPDCLVCVNFAYLSVQPEIPEVAVDWLSGDMPHAFSTDLLTFQARVLDTRGMPWDLMLWAFTVPPSRNSPPWPPSLPAKPTAQLCQEASTVLAAGGSIGFYLQPQRSGYLPTHQHAVIADVSAFCRTRQSVSQHTRSVPQVAVLNSAHHLYSARRGPTQRPNQTFAGGGVGPPNPVQGAVIALLDNCFHVDVVGDDALVDRIEDFAMVVVPEQTGLPAELVARLERYVRSGGRLLLSGADIAESTGDLAGVRPARAAMPEVGYLAHDRGVALVGAPWQAVELVGADTLMPLLADQELGKDETGWPAVTVRRVGDGRVAAIHGPVFREYMAFHSTALRHVVGSVCDALAPDVAVKVEGATSGLHLTLRTKDDDTVVHLLNKAVDHEMSPRRPEVEHIPNIGPLTIRLFRDAEPRSVRIVPDAHIDWSYEHGEVRVALPRLGIHAAVVVTG